MVLVGHCGRITIQLPIRQGSSRPVLPEREFLATHRAPPHFMAAFATEAEREGCGERMAFYCLSIYWQIPQAAQPTPSQCLNNATTPLDCILCSWSLLPPAINIQHFHQVARVPAPCPVQPPTEAHCDPLHQGTSTQANSTKKCNHAQIFSALSLSLYLPHTDTQSLTGSMSLWKFHCIHFTLSAPPCLQKGWQSFIIKHDGFIITTPFWPVLPLRKHSVCFLYLLLFIVQSWGEQVPGDRLFSVSTQFFSQVPCYTAVLLSGLFLGIDCFPKGKKSPLI